MRLAFVHAPDPGYSQTQNFGNRYMPIWAYTLASHLPDGHDLSLHDTRVQSVLEIPRADLYVFSGINQDLDHLLEVRAAVATRYPTATCALGGPICWSFEQADKLDDLRPFDYLAIGDGEELIAELVERVERGDPERILRAPARFDMSKARPMHRGLVEQSARDYYGAVVEVSRGCPFLCEFCDIRIQPDNNRAHNKAPAVIVEEVDHLCELGVTSFMFACDNFIGDHQWAHEVADRLIAWRERTGHSPSIFTWLTINFYKDEVLMRKMRRAGFDMLFIGVESFDENSLLEMAKVQNRNKQLDLPEILRRIQSFGFVITPGLIFGFDSDSAEVFDMTLRGLEESGLLVTNSGILFALPGTPLYRRMKLAGRLRSGEAHIGRFKFQTNIRYLRRHRNLVDGYIRFVEDLSDGRHQYRRFKSYFSALQTGNYVPHEGAGYGNIVEYGRNLLRNREGLKNFTRRMRTFARDPRALAYALRAFALVVRKRREVPDGMRALQVWLYGWTNFTMVDSSLKAEDFDLEFMNEPISRQAVLPEGYDTDDAGEQIPRSKTRAQLRNTIMQLERLLKG